MRYANDIVTIEMEPDFGARVTSLRDLRTGREWLIEGEPTGSSADDAGYGADQARGWDECFPTIISTDGVEFGWPGRLRDHGALWGRPWQCREEADGLTAVCTDSRFRFSRNLRVAGDTISVDYTISNTGAERFAYLYSQHMLLSLQEGERVAVSGVGPLFPNGGSPGDGIRWPGFPEFNPVRGIDAGVMAKLYGNLESDARIVAGSPEQAIALRWSARDLPAVGLWFDYGGWPPESPVHQVAVEPTSAPAAALTAPAAIWLASGESRAWRIEIRLLDAENLQEGLFDE
ncbi:hypothetical protein [Bauldia sp.]|uniref:hypothetical protein n=1 Tax=Bauldia sp. TaxID=2575872 RepID=UPI003BA8C2BD